MSDEKSQSARLMTRRGFHRTATAALTGAVAAGILPQTGLSQEKKQKEYPPGKYVDMHVHLGQPWNERGPLTPEMMLKWMDARSISQAVVLSLISPESWFYPITPHWVLEQTKEYRDRLIPFCSVDPRSPYMANDRTLVDILKRYIDAGAKGFGEHKWGGKMDDPRNIRVFKACEKVGLPVLFHMDNIRNTDKPGLPGLEKVLKEVPGTNFIGHAQGWWASISGDVAARDMGGYPKGKVAPGGAIDRLMEKYPNIYGDLSAGSGANSLSRDLEFGREFLIRRADRICFGTDYLANGQTVPQFELLDKLDLPDEVEAKIYRKNARKLLGL